MPLIKKLFPTAYYDRIFDIPLAVLNKKGVKCLIFDIDNTLSAHDIPEPDDEIVEFIKKAADDGFSVCLLSNNSKKRVELYNKRLNVHCVHMANKPFAGGLKRAMGLLGANQKDAVLIGDQVFTDVLCGNLAGIRTILVKPCSERDVWITKVKRGLEQKIIDKYLESRQKE